jgi:uncharacterized membrane protein YjjP (DUF1212 family)
MSDIVSPYEELLSIVDNLENEYLEYKKSPKALDYVLKKRAELIIQLTKVLNLIMMYDTNAVVTSIAHSIDEIKKNDSELDSLLIRVDYVPNGQKTGFIKIQAHK